MVNAPEVGQAMTLMTTAVAKNVNARFSKRRGRLCLPDCRHF